MSTPIENKKIQILIKQLRYTYRQQEIITAYQYLYQPYLRVDGPVNPNLVEWLKKNYNPSCDVTITNDEPMEVD